MLGTIPYHVFRFHALLLNRKKRESGKIQGNQEAIAKAYVKLFAELSSDVATEFLPTVGLDKLEARHQPSQIMEVSTQKPSYTLQVKIAVPLCCNCLQY